MKSFGKYSVFLSYVEMVVAVILFFTMLISCGKYINIKLNGKTSNLPYLSENDKRMLLSSNTQDTTVFDDDLLEPTFIGIKNDAVMKSLPADDDVRRAAKNVLYDSLSFLFDGTNRSVKFRSQNELESYIEKVKAENAYVFLSFYCDVPSTIVLPCLVDNFKSNGADVPFLFRNLFILPDKDGLLYGIAVSQDLAVTELYSRQNIRFDKILNETYDISDNLIDFEFSGIGIINPVLTSSLTTNTYVIESLPEIYGKENNPWVKNLFDVFSLNSNLVKSFTSGDGDEINYVEQHSELIVKNNGDVEFKTSDEGGVNLREYVSYVSENADGVSLSEKFFALKKLINQLDDADNTVSYSFAGVSYDIENDSLKVYFKYMKDGIFLYNSGYDAVFEISNNILKYASFKSVRCESVSYDNVVIPQKYVAASEHAANKCTFLSLVEECDGIRYPDWVVGTVETEVEK